MMFSGPQLHGIPVRTNSALNEFEPVLQVRSNVPMTDAFRQEMNDWLIAMFGKRRAFYKIQGTLIMHPNNLRFLERQADKHFPRAFA